MTHVLVDPSSSNLSVGNELVLSPGLKASQFIGPQLPIITGHGLSDALAHVPKDQDWTETVFLVWRFGGRRDD